MSTNLPPDDSLLPEKTQKTSGVKKQIPLRISKELFAALSEWAEEEFRSVNGQIEFLLVECVKKRRR